MYRPAYCFYGCCELGGDNDRDDFVGRTVGGVVTALGQLLVLEAVAMHGTDGGYTCPHSLR